VSTEPTIVDPGEPDPGASSPEEPAVTDTATPRWRRWVGVSSRNAYLVVVAGAVLVVTRAIDFSPPPEVRVGKANVAQLVGDAPTQEFSAELSNPQAVQVRATLRLYADNELKVGGVDPELDEQGKILSQPVVTTILGMNATIDQTVRLEGGELEITLGLDATPRLVGAVKKGQPPPEIVLEHDLSVRSRRDGWWNSAPVERIHVDTSGFLGKVEEHGHRLVFTVDEHLFSLDLEVHRAAVAAPALARTKT
jgi:hypothetical protein